MSRALGNSGRAGRDAGEVAAGGPQGLECARVRTISFSAQVRVSLSKIGFCPGNRGGLGISPAHVQEIAWSCNTEKKGVVLCRYQHVDLVRVPDGEELERFRQCNKEKCTSDALMPKFSPEMHLGCLTKTHFCHGLKLRVESDRFVFNDGKTKIQMQRDSPGSEDVIIRDHGVLATIYKSDLYTDTEAMQAIMNADNDDADVEMAEDEIQAQGRVESAIHSLNAAAKANGAPAEAKVKLSRERVLEYMMRTGLRSFSEEKTLNLIDFRLSIHPQIATCFRNLIFWGVNGRVSVHPSDYHSVACCIDFRCQWTRPQTPGSRTAPGALRVASLRPRFDNLGMPTCCMGVLIRNAALLLTHVMRPQARLQRRNTRTVSQPQSGDESAPPSANSRAR